VYDDSGELDLWRLTFSVDTLDTGYLPIAARELRAKMLWAEEPAEFAAGRAGGSKNVPFGTLETSNDLPKNKTVPLLLMCPTGARANRAVATLRKRGYEKTVSVSGGLAAWREANLPTERSA
jgi:rhodanese-related sulfurtransferase